MVSYRSNASDDFKTVSSRSSVDYKTPRSVISNDDSFRSSRSQPTPLPTNVNSSVLDSLCESKTDDLDEMFSYARHGRYDCIQNGLKQGIPVDIRDEVGNTMLIIACQNGNKKTAKLVLRNGANINVKNYKGNTPLHYCFHCKISSFIIIILSSLNSCFILVGYGESVGEYLIEKVFICIQKCDHFVIITQGADTSIRNNKGYYCWDGI
jgi:ankyrin repeat protein